MNKKHLADLKMFARAEMARELGARHGRTLRLPWDPAEPTAEPAAPEFDFRALEDLPDGD